MGPFAELAVVVLTGVTLTLALVGMAVRFVLMPYLRQHLFEPVAQTNKQVTVNHHSSPEPTVLDKIDDVHKEVQTFARMFDGHLEWSQREVDQLWRELKRKRDKP